MEVNEIAPEPIVQTNSMATSKRKYIFILILIVFLLAVVGGIGALFVRQSLTKTESSVIPTPTIPLLKPSMLHVITGTVTMKNINTGEQRTAQKEQDFAIHEGDLVETDTNSVATIDYHDGTVVRLGPESSILYGKKNTTMHFQQIIGNVYYRFKKSIGFRDELEIETSGALAAVRGTTLAIFHHETTKLVVTSNTVDFYKKDEHGKVIESSKVSVTQNMQSETASGSATIPLSVSEATASAQEQEWLDFNVLADQLYDRDDGLPSQTSTQLLEEQTLTFLKKLEVLLTPSPTPTPTPTLTPAQSPTPTTLPVQKLNEMPGTGYHTGSVQTDAGTFSLSCIGANKNSTKVITDSANENDCTNDCPVKPLAEYVSANGGFAGMNGMYFCPPDYAACADKKNSFDTLLFNSRVKRYINSDNNVYSVIPFLVVDGGGNPKFIAHSQEWGRDTGIQAGIAGNPLLIHGGSNVVGNYSLDSKQNTVKSNRGAFVQQGENIYLCVTKGATVPDSAKVYERLHVDNAINIDGGGSTAMYVNGGYKFGPGRALPNAIIFANR